MKSKIFTKKLKLNKKTIANLNSNDMEAARGGICTIISLPQSTCMTKTGFCCE